MPNFIFAYHGGKMPETPEEGAEVMAKWEVWMGGLGAAMVDPGAPLGMSKTVSAGGVSDGGGANPLSGYSIITADSTEVAVDLAKGCPIIESGSTIEIAEAMKM